MVELIKIILNFFRRPFENIISFGNSSSALVAACNRSRCDLPKRFTAVLDIHEGCHDQFTVSSLSLHYSILVTCFSMTFLGNSTVRGILPKYQRSLYFPFSGLRELFSFYRLSCRGLRGKLDTSAYHRVDI
jgi:hypothetical protein